MIEAKIGQIREKEGEATLFLTIICHRHQQLELSKKTFNHSRLLLSHQPATIGMPEGIHLVEQFRKMTLLQKRFEVH